MLWTRTANGYTALSMNDQEVVGTQANGDVQAYSATDGVPSWTNAQMKWRKLSAPLLVGRTVAVGDYQGYISFLSAKDGSIVGRVATDGSAIQAAPVVVGKTLVAVTGQGRGLRLRAGLRGCEQIRHVRSSRPNTPARRYKCSPCRGARLCFAP
jgi:hypothetical protein